MKNLSSNKRKLAILNGSVLLIIILLLLFVIKPYYDCTLTILPDYGTQTNTLTQLGGLSSLAGINSNVATPAMIYQQLVTSEPILHPVFYSKYKTVKFQDSVNLVEYYDYEPDTNLPQELQERAMFLKLFIDFVNSRLKTNLDASTNILTITVRTSEPQLSSDIANKIGKSLDQYVRTQRKSNTSEQLFYIQKRISQVHDSLVIAENALKTFQELNRSIEQSPKLMLEKNRLSRLVNVLNLVYTQLQQQSEVAKIDVVKDAPIINIMAEAQNPIYKTGPSWPLVILITLFLSGLFSGFYFLFLPELKNYFLILIGRKGVVD